MKAFKFFQFSRSSILACIAAACLSSTVDLRGQGALDPSFNTGTGAEDAVQTLAVQSDGKIIAAGLFFNINGATNSLGIARLNTNGSVDGSFNPGTSVDFGISSVAVQADGKIVLGGGFTQYQGSSRNGITRTSTNGSRDDSFSPGTGVNDIINSVCLQPDGKIMIAGAFTLFNGTGRSGVARVNTNGTLDTTFNPGTGIDFAAQSVFVQPDGKFLLAGGFVNYNGVQRRGVVRINANGSRDDAFNPGPSVDDLVRVVCEQPDGKVLIAGDFTSFNGFSRSRIARLNANGSLDTSFDPGTGANGSIYTLVLQPNGKIVVAGSFTTVNGINRNRIARLLPDGSVDLNFNSGTGANNTVAALVLQSDGKVVLGGLFTALNSSSQVRLARLLLSDPLQTPVITSVVPNGTGVTLSWNSISNAIYRVEYTGSLVAPSWTPLTNLTSKTIMTTTTDNPGSASQRYYRLALLPW